MGVPFTRAPILPPRRIAAHLWITSSPRSAGLRGCSGDSRRTLLPRPQPRWWPSACGSGCAPSAPIRRAILSSPTRIVRAEVRRHNDFALARGLAPVDDEASCVREVLAAVAGYGPLQPYLDDPTVEELWINAPDRIFIARAGVAERVPLALTDSAVRDLVERMLHATGRRVDLSQPFVDASLPDGSRLHVVIPDITRRHWSVNIRKFLPAYRDLDRLVATGSVDARGRRAAARGDDATGRSILVSGATHAGKTTLLGALIAACPPDHRIVTVEETFELAVDAPDLVALQGRQPSLEGTGEVTLRRLVKEALRMRPDRLVVGEVRDAEALDLLLALNTGVPGAATIHANSAREALAKLAALPLLAGRNIDAGFVLPAVAASVDLVAHCERDASGRRRVVEIVEPTGVVGGDGRGADGVPGGCRMTFVWGAVLAAGLLLVVSPWVWPARRPKPPAASTGRLARLLESAGLTRVPPAGPVAASVSVRPSSLAAVAWLLTQVAALAARRGDRRRARARSRGCAPDARGSCARAARCGPTSATCSSPRCARGCRLPDAVASLAESAPGPLRPPFAAFARDVAASGHFDSSAAAISRSALADPVGDRIVETLRMARQVGGTELTPVLRALAASVRADAALRAEVESRQSWIRGAAVLGVAAPWVILALLAMRPEGARAYSSPEGVALILAGAAVSFVAYRVMLRIGRLPEPRRWFG